MNSFARITREKLRRQPGQRLPEQLYGLLRQEILRGRWQVGERIPSYKALTAMTGLSQTPIQAALARLEEDGYIERVRHRGVFVKSTVSASNSSLGRLLIAVPAEEPRHSHHAGAPVVTDTFGLLNIMTLQEEARRLGLSSEPIAVPPPKADGSVPQSVSAAFDPDGLGVLSLLPAHRLNPCLRDRGLPIVYIGPDDPFSAPALTGDPCRAAYSVVRRLLELGHERLAVLPTPAAEPLVRSAVGRGIAHALEEVGLPPAPAPDEQAGAGMMLDLKQIRTFLEENGDATALFCLSIDDARRVYEVADMMEIAIPEQLSLASLQTGTLEPWRDATVLGATYQWEEIIRTCFDMLMAPGGGAEQSLFRYVFAPHVMDGESVAAPS